MLKLIFSRKDSAPQNSELDTIYTPAAQSQAVIEFDMDGNIINANKSFLETLGYTLDEIQGKHHSLFVDAQYADSSDYYTFWVKLREGKCQSGEYKRLGKNGREVWMEASYNPIFDTHGRPFKVVKYASDITQQILARRPRPNY